MIKLDHYSSVITHPPQLTAQEINTGKCQLEQCEIETTKINSST